MQQDKQRISWLDIIKLIAIFMVVAGHCADFVSPNERFTPEYITWGTFWGTFMRPAVPLFVMVTGALLLPVRRTMHNFYQHRIPRLLVPFFIWSILYNLFPWFTGILGYSPEIIQEFFPWGTTSQSFEDALQNIIMLPLNFSCFGVQMWYVYLLLGIYLYLPIFSAWVERATQRERHFFLFIWFITLFIPYLRQYLTTNLWGTCSWNEFGMLYSFAGFNGYLLLGYELRHHQLPLQGKSLGSLLLLTFCVGYAITYYGFKHILSLGNQPEAMVELFFTYCSPNVMLMTVPIFIAAQRVTFTHTYSRNLLKSISEATLGIWMIHYFLLGPCNTILTSYGFTMLPRMLTCSIILFFICWGIVALVHRTGNVGRWIMG